MSERVDELVKSLSKGPCSCIHRNGHFSISTDVVTGEQKVDHDPGPVTRCLRCKAREALEADDIPYEKDDRVVWTVLNMGFTMDPATACKAFGLFTMVTGSAVYLGG